jgi:hypothetical protein
VSVFIKVYLANEAGPVPLVLDLRIAHDRWGSSSDPSINVTFMPIIAITFGRLHSEFVLLLFLQTHRETDRFFTTSGVQLTRSTSVLYHYKCVVFSSQVKIKYVNILVKSAALRITLNVDGAPVSSRSHTHPSHS